MILKGRRDFGDGCYTAIYEDDKYKYTLKVSDGIRVVSAEPFDPCRPVIAITDKEPARLEFFGGVLMEEMLGSYMAALSEVPDITEQMRKLV